MSRLSTIELYKENMVFSIAHFIAFSQTERSPLHGHNYNVYAALTTEIGEEGLSFDCRNYMEKLSQLCLDIDHTTIIPGKCKFINIKESGDYYHVDFNNETIIFLKRDVMILPIHNVTTEELADYVLQQLLKDQTQLATDKIQKIKIKVFAGPGQSGSATWKRI